MKLHRVVIDWQGPYVKGRAVTVLHFDGTEQAAPPIPGLRAAFAAANNVLNPGGTIVFPSSGDSIDDTTGALNGSWAVAAVAPVACVAPGSAPAGVGACITWTTGGIVMGAAGRPRRLRGRTFLVPIGGDAYDTDGTLKPAHVAAFQTLADGIRGAGGLAVWHRPVGVGAANGNSYGVIAGSVRDKVAVLRSRRD